MYKSMPVSKVCCRCKLEKDVKDNFHYEWNNLSKTISSYCKSCQVAHAKTQYKEFRQQCLFYKGEACEVCGYNKHPEILYLIPKLGSKVKFTQETKDKLDKSKLLCPTCFAEHSLVKKES